MDEDWSLAVDAVEARISELRMSRANLAAAAGIDIKTVGNFLDRGMRPRSESRGGYEQALGWEYGSLRAIARGGRPKPAGAGDPHATVTPDETAPVGPSGDDVSYVADRGSDDRPPRISDSELLEEIRRVRAEVDERFDDLERRLRDRSVESPP